MKKSLLVFLVLVFFACSAFCEAGSLESLLEAFPELKIPDQGELGEVHEGDIVIIDGKEIYLKATATPQVTPEPTAVPTPEPTAVSTPEPTTEPVVQDAPKQGVQAQVQPVEQIQPASTVMVPHTEMSSTEIGMAMVQGQILNKVERGTIISMNGATSLMIFNNGVWEKYDIPVNDVFFPVDVELVVIY